MSTRLTKHNLIGFTGDGDHKHNHWPHPINEKFNTEIRSVVGIYGIGAKSDFPLLKRCRDYLISRIELLVDHKVKRDTEEYYQVMNIQINHGFNKKAHEQQELIENAGLLLCVGNWREDDKALRQYKFGRLSNKPIYEMRYDGKIPIKDIFRYLQPIRPIKDEAWDSTKQDNVLIFETPEGHLELMDGNHRHEFANRIGTVTHLQGWIIKEV